MLDIHILGPLSVTLQDRSIVPTAGKPRQVLALLALRVGHVVPVTTLMEEVWGESPPRSAATTLQTYILQLRRLLASADPTTAAREHLARRYCGYGLHIRSTPADDAAGSARRRLDVDEYDALAAAGNAAHEAGDHRHAAEFLHRALQMWHGPALADTPLGPFLELETMRLEESRIALLERRVDADLHLGRHTSLVPELRTLVGLHPFHEGFCAQLMVALHRSGGAVRALDAYQRLRTSLVTELGLEPSLRLRRLQEAVLAGDAEVVG